MMTKTKTLLAVGLLATLFSTARLQAINGKVLFDDNRAMSVDMIGPTGNKMMRMIILDSGATLEHPINKITGVTFELPFDQEELKRNYTFGSYTNVLTVLEPFLPEMYPFLDLQSNVKPLYSMMVRSQYWEKKYADAIAVCNRLTRAFPDDSPAQMEFRLMRILCQHGLGQPKETIKPLNEFPKLDIRDPLSPLYWYSMAQLHASTNNLYEANDYAAKIIAFAPKELDWMPPALFLTARFNASTNQFDVARQICKELELVAQNTPWQQRAVDFVPQIGEMERDYKAELKRREEEAAAKVDNSPLRKVNVQFE